MNSNTQSRLGALPQWRVSDLTPDLSATTISPGRMSRSNRAPMASRAQDSEANTTPPSFRRPMHSGRKPWGSRTAMSLVGEEITRE